MLRFLAKKLLRCPPCKKITEMPPTFFDEMLSKKIAEMSPLLLLGELKKKICAKQKIGEGVVN